MSLTSMQVIVNVAVWYFIFGHVQSWIWLLEARIKSADLKDPAWAEYLNSLKGIVSFTLLGTVFWLPAILYNMILRIRHRKARRLSMTWFQAFQKASRIYRDLFQRNQDIQ